MFATTFLANAFAATLVTLAATTPTPMIRNGSVYHGVSININTASSGQSATYEPAPVEINKLTSLGNETYATELIFDHGVAVNVDIDSVECRAYQDQAGVRPGSAPFTNSQPAKLSTNLVWIQSILCYITESL